MRQPTQDLRILVTFVDNTKNSLFPTENKPRPIAFAGSSINGEVITCQ